MFKRGVVVVALIATVLSPIALIASPAQAAAATCTGSENKVWTNGNGTNLFNDGANWSPAGYPSMSDSVCVPNGSPTLVVNTSTTINGITAEANTSVNVNSGMTFMSLANIQLHNALIDGTVYLPGGLTSTINGSLVVTPSGSLDGDTTPTYDINGGANFGNNSGGTVALRANININSGAAYADSAALDVTGFAITVNNGGSLTSVSSASVTASSLTVNTGGTFTDAHAGTIIAATTVGGGTFYSNGTVNGNLAMSSGRVGVSAAGVGQLAVTGNYTQTGGTLFLNANNTTATTGFGNLAVTGAANISGSSTIEYTLRSGYTGAALDFLVPITAASASGLFATTAVNNLGANLGAHNTIFSNVYEVVITSTAGNVSGHIYQDWNGDGTLTPTDNVGIDGVIVYSDTNNNGSLNGGEPSATANSGVYVLFGVPQGTAHIRQQLPSGGYIQSTTAPLDVTITGGGLTTEANIGLFKLGATRGTVTNVDTNTPLQGVTLYIDANNNNVLDNGEQSTSSAANGTYTLSGLHYALATRVRAVAPDGLQLATQKPGDHEVISGLNYQGDDFGFKSVTVTTGPQDPLSKGTGYWTVLPDGTINAFGSAANLGEPKSAGNLNAKTIQVVANPQGGGYWVLGSDGGVFSYGTSTFFGSTGGTKLNKPIAAMVPTNTGNGYWLVASDGGVFAYGDAGFYGSLGSQRLKSAIVGAAPSAGGHGYYMVGADGGVFAFGDAKFFGSMSSQPLNQPMASIVATSDSNGYWLFAKDGGVFAFGSAGFLGSKIN